MSLVTLEAFKEAIQVADTVDDADLQRALDAASQWIETYCGRTFEPVDTDDSARLFTAVYPDRLSVADLSSVSEVAVDDAYDSTFSLVLPASSYQLYPLDVGIAGVIGGYTEIRIRPGSSSGFIVGADVRVTAIWGFGSVPAAVEQACILLANRYFHRLSAPFGVLETGQIGEVASISDQDQDVVALLAPYGVAGGSAAGSSASTWVAV